MNQAHRDRRLSAVAIRADGTRVPVRLPDPAESTVFGKLVLLVTGLLALITGSRREPGGRRW